MATVKTLACRGGDGTGQKILLTIIV